jgi:lipoprotein-anchoring transpeptidase ErfK/SrfK
MKFANASLGTIAFALVLSAAPVQSTAAEEPVPAAPAATAEIAAAAPAPVAVPVPARPAVAAPESLAPGQFDWRPELASDGPVDIVVSIPLQRAYVYRAGTLIGVTTVSTGRPGHATPTGRFPILEKRREHYSNLYNNAPMPFMQRLTWDGVALHAGQIPGRPASHGCVRLPLAFARTLFSATQVGAVVHITDQAPRPEMALAAVGSNRLASLQATGSVMLGTR